MSVQSATLAVTLDANNQPQPLAIAPSAQIPGGSSIVGAVVSNCTPYIAVLSGANGTQLDVAIPPGTAQLIASDTRTPLKITAWINPLGTLSPASTPQILVTYATQEISELDDIPTGSLGFSALYVSGGISGSVTIDGGEVSISGPITGTVTVDGPVEIENVPGGQLNIGGTVEVSNTVNASITNTVETTVSGDVSVQGVPGGTAIGVAGEVSIAAGATVDIGNTPAVTVDSGNVTVSGAVDISSGTVDATLTGPVEISGPVTVENVTGTSLSTVDGASAAIPLSSTGTLQYITGVVPANATYLMFIQPSGGGTGSANLLQVTGATTGARYTPQAMVLNASVPIIVPIDATADSQYNIVAGTTPPDCWAGFSTPFQVVDASLPWDGNLASYSGNGWSILDTPPDGAFIESMHWQITPGSANSTLIFDFSGPEIARTTVQSAWNAPVTGEVKFPCPYPLNGASIRVSGNVAAVNVGAVHVWGTYRLRP